MKTLIVNADGTTVERDLTPEEIAALPQAPEITEGDYQRAIEQHVEAVAQGRRYSSAATCASYVTSAVPVWAAEAAAFVAWRDAVYVAAFAALEEFEGGGDPPTVEEFIASLPVMEWPA